jgi:Outer membrane protein beta-barrel domain
MLPWNQRLRLGLIACAMLGLWPAPIVAQGLTYGAKGGLDLTRVRFGSSFAPDTPLEPGAVAGGFVEVKLVGRLSLRGEALFAMERVPFESVVTDTFRFIDVPILARYRIASLRGHVIHATGGFVARSLLDAVESDGQDTSSIKEGVAKSNQILTIGGSVSMLPHWTADVRYLYGRNGMYKRIGGGTVGKSQSVQVTAEYGF